MGTGVGCGSRDRVSRVKNGGMGAGEGHGDGLWTICAHSFSFTFSALPLSLKARKASWVLLPTSDNSQGGGLHSQPWLPRNLLFLLTHLPWPHIPRDGLGDLLAVADQRARLEGLAGVLGD